MGHELIKPVRASELARLLGLELFGEDLVIRRVSSLNDGNPGTLCFSKGRLHSGVDGAVVIAEEYDHECPAAILLTNKPRLFFAKALDLIAEKYGFGKPTDPADIHPTVEVGNYCSIGRGVQIGPGGIIGNNVTIADGVHIGRECVIKSGAVIGEPGFGFENDEQGMPYRIRHLGSVVVGNYVEIGSLNTVCCGTLDNTIIDDYAKLDDHVHVAHNVHIKRGAIVTACAELSGGVTVGERAWIGPNSAVMQKVSIGDHAVVGIAANVIRGVEAGMTVAGNPARVLRPK